MRAMDVTELLDGLNPPQREAVASPLNHQLVLAGAGSGKTRVLVHRIAWLMQIEHISPSSIMAVTFTNKAAKEMRSRVEELTGISPKHLWIGTFHSLAHRLLRTHWKQANLSENFQVMDSDDQLRLIKRIVRGLNIDEEVYQPKQAQWYINAQKDEGLRPQHIQPFGDQWAQTMVTIYSAYEEACQRAGLVDFAELLFRAHELWLNNPSLLTQYQQRFRYILVDEFQDTNTIQYAWLRVLAGNAIPVMAVGDDDQSIYGWRGARIENIQQFSKDFAGAQEIKLEQNYRSTGNILKAANSVIDNNPTRLGKNLWTEGDQGEPIALYAAFNEQDEARFIVDQVESHFKNNDRTYQDMAVLYRSNAQSRVLEEAFIRAGLPYRIYGGQRFYERLEIKNAMAYLRLLQNRHDDASLERVINVPARAIGEKTVETLRQYAREHGTSLWQALEQAIRKDLLAARATTALQKFESLIDEMEVTCQSIELHEQVDHVIQTSGLIEHHMKEKGEKAQARIENLEELVNAAKTFDPDDIEAVDENGEPVDVEYASPLAAFLDQAALDAGDAQADEFEDSVQMMTLHSAKGLEFPVVFMAGLEEGLFPHKMSADDPNRLEEERRLCYVGITRAMEKLYICYAESRRMYGQENFASPSRFIREIPHDTIEEVRLKATVSKPVSQQFSVESAQEATGLKIGQQVWHAKFGEGTVLDMEGQGAQARVQVSFDFDGTKWLVAAYANLRPMDL
ncbi:DNA helicase II [Oceanobacter sp. RED65]|uniref:DNA 3'-5' helicase n=2 Tax=Bermanella marisrubri TaxID=207949 RepID=Q1N3X2_9GAMM|nr:DNA helicase II [Oceanobacter sp. RED65] [Bermanella marisrubri]